MTILNICSSSPFTTDIEDHLLGLEALDSLQSQEEPSFFVDRRIQVGWLIVTAPLRHILEIFLRCIGGIAGCLGGKKIEIACKVLASHLSSDINEILNYFRYGKNLLVPTRNRHQILPPIYLQDYESDCSKPSENRNFYQEKGVCFGGSLWFAYLMHMTSEIPYPDKQSQLIAIPKQFSSVVPSQGTFFQKISMSKSNKQIPFFSSSPSAKISFKNRQDINTTQNAIGHLDQGLLYGVKLYLHSTGGHYLLVFKESESDLYVMDLNVGLLHFQGNISAQFHNYLKKYESHIKLENPPSHFLKFIPMHNESII